MKKALLVFYIALVPLLAIPSAVCAVSSSSEESSATTTILSAETSGFLTWEALATYTGCLAATLIFTQIFKNIWPAKWPKQILSYLIAVVLLILANWSVHTLTANSTVLCFINAAIISLAANGSFNGIKSAINTKSNGQ